MYLGSGLRSGFAGALAAALLVAAGCTGGASPSPAAADPSPSASVTPSTPAPTVSPSAGPDATSSAVAGSAGPSPTRVVSPEPTPAKPPAATLRGLTGSAVPGDLGSYTWGSGGSDAPWIVGKVAGTVSRGRKLDVAFGGAAPGTWTAAWAKVSGGTAGSASGGSSGSGPVVVTAPRAGDWSLRVTATFGPGHNATYFWHLTVTG